MTARLRHLVGVDVEHVDPVGAARREAVPEREVGMLLRQVLAPVVRVPDVEGDARRRESRGGGAHVLADAQHPVRMPHEERPGSASAA